MGKHPPAVGYDKRDNETFIKPDRGNEAEHQVCMTRRRWIALAVVVVILAALVITVVVIFVVKSDDAEKEEKAKYKRECGPFDLPKGAKVGPPTIYSPSKTCPLKGDCWSGEQCFQCFKLPRYKVGNINHIPVCCPNCEIRGMKMSPDSCTCDL